MMQVVKLLQFAKKHISKRYTWQDMGPGVIQKRAVTASSNCYCVTWYYAQK